MVFQHIKTRHKAWIDIFGSRLPSFRFRLAFWNNFCLRGWAKTGLMKSGKGLCLAKLKSCGRSPGWSPRAWVVCALGSLCRLWFAFSSMYSFILGTGSGFDWVAIPAAAPCRFVRCADALDCPVSSIFCAGGCAVSGLRCTCVKSEVRSGLVHHEQERQLLYWSSRALCLCIAASALQQRL